METIQFDSGIKEFQLGSGVLRFNPADPNLYARFMESADMIRELDSHLQKKSEETSKPQVLCLLEEADRQLKQILSWVFGPGNDFEVLLSGVNLLAVAGNGQRVLTNLLKALEPVLIDGARQCAREQTEAAVAKAQARRENA